MDGSRKIHPVASFSRVCFLPIRSQRAFPDRDDAWCEFHRGRWQDAGTYRATGNRIDSCSRQFWFALRTVSVLERGSTRASGAWRAYWRGGIDHRSEKWFTVNHLNQSLDAVCFG